MNKRNNDILDKLGAKFRYVGEEMIIIDNYQYVESFSYERDKFALPSVFTVELYEGGSFELYKNDGLTYSLDSFHAPNIYGKLLSDKSSEKNGLITDSREWELYFKLLIIEDRLVNPYKVLKNNTTLTMVPMKESLAWIKDYEKEIDLINEVLAKLDGYLISDIGSPSYMYFGIKPTILYLEIIGDMELAKKVRKFSDKEMDINYVLEKARDMAYGLIFANEHTEIKLL